jgi:hypothetical protein
MPIAPPSTAFQGESFSVNPPGVVFGKQLVNTTSAPRTLTVTNTGNTPQPVRGRVGGPPGNWQDYTLTTACPSVIAVGASCTFSITFTPSATGDRSAILVLDGINDEDTVVGLGGIGTN